PKVSYMYKAYMTGKLNEVIKDKTSGPSDDDLFCAIHKGYQQAWDFAKVLSMNDFSDFFINNSSQSNEVFDSYTIAMVANVLADFNMLNLCNDDIENDLRDAHFELAFLLSDMNSLDDQNFLDNQNLETHENFYTGVTKAEILDVSYLDFSHINSICPNMKNHSRLSVLSNMNKKVDLSGITIANIREHNSLRRHGYG
ncbi:9905_t:CDS:2, partial [Dentiscutata heterogama]